MHHKVDLQLGAASDLQRSFGSIRHDTRQEQRADASVVAAQGLESSILRLETGLRGYVLTSDKRFLQPYVQARRDLPAQSCCS